MVIYSSRDNVTHPKLNKLKSCLIRIFSKIFPQIVKPNCSRLTFSFLVKFDNTFLFETFNSTAEKVTHVFTVYRLFSSSAITSKNETFIIHVGSSCEISLQCFN